VARAEAGAHQVRWVEGDGTSVIVTYRDVALLTGNTAQAITDPGQWAMTLQATLSCLGRVDTWLSRHQTRRRGRGRSGRERPPIG
jgi:hypothetical protein